MRRAAKKENRKIIISLVTDTEQREKATNKKKGTEPQKTEWIP